jgi:hypothetical protein
MSCASLEINQLLSMVIAPGGVADYGGQNYHLVSGTVDRDESGCREDCFFSTRLLALGDHVGFDATGPHKAAAAIRKARSARQHKPFVRMSLGIERLLERVRSGVPGS